VTVGSVMTRPVAVPATMELDTLLETLRVGGLQMAVVADEFGNVDGIVTFEDLIEEIVGEVIDEHDDAELIADQRSDGSWLLSGLLRPDQASSRLGVRLPEDDHYETLGGLVTFLAGRMPGVGDAVEIEVPTDDGTGHTVTWALTVHSMDGHRVDEVLARPTESAPSASEVDR
jgi:CBS domain containing-hemolysin-like protein